jgi:hypothetical protein
MIRMGKDSRPGECLWQEWTGDGFTAAKPDAVVFYTSEHVDVENEIVRRALASALQRDGSVISLGQGFASIDNGTVSQGYAGEVSGSRDLSVCDENGETSYGDIVDNLTQVTWVEV